MTPPRGLAEGGRNAQKVWASTLGMAKKNKTKRSKKGGRQRFMLAAVSAQPRTMVVQFRFQQNQTLVEGAAGVGATYAFRLNSLYDPNATGVGNQPVGYDQWSALFNRSTVFRCSITVQMVNTGTLPSEFGIFPLIGASPVPTSTSSWSCQYGSSSSLLGTTGRNVFTTKRNYDIAKLFGISKAKLLAEEEYSEQPAGPAVAGNNQAFLYIWTRGIGAVGSCALRVQMLFTARLFDPVSMDLS